MNTKEVIFSAVIILLSVLTVLICIGILQSNFAATNEVVMVLLLNNAVINIVAWILWIKAITHLNHKPE